MLPGAGRFPQACAAILPAQQPAYRSPRPKNRPRRSTEIPGGAGFSVLRRTNKHKIADQIFSRPGSTKCRMMPAMAAKAMPLRVMEPKLMAAPPTPRMRIAAAMHRLRG